MLLLNIYRSIDITPLINSKRTKREDIYYEYSPYLMISAVLTKRDDSEWTDDELFPAAEIAMEDLQRCGGYGPVRIRLKDGAEYEVSYEGMEGTLQI